MYCRRATKNILLQRYILTWCNWEFFREGEVFWNKGTSVSISSTAHERKAQYGKIFEFLLLDTLKT